MAGVRASMREIADEQELLGILGEIDRTAKTNVQRWADKRGAPRKRLRLSCSIRHVTVDTGIVCTVLGKTRDISTTGIAFVSDTHFLRKTPMEISLALSGGRTRTLTGHAVYSRVVREGWFLTGVAFGPVSDKHLSQREPAQVSKPATDPKSTSAEQKPATERDAADARGGTRERSLALLAAAGSSKTRAKQMISKVVVLSVAPDHVVRQATIPVFMELADKEGIMGLIGLLKDANSTVRGEAAEALGKLEASDAVEPLRRLLAGENSEVTLRAAEALGRIGDQTGLPVAVRFLRHDGPRTRLAARVLGVIVGQNFRPSLKGVTDARDYVKAKGL